MFQNYYKIAIRNLLKYKFYSIINILGLSVGIAAFLFIFLYIQDELSYDKYHEKSEQIVRIDAYARLGDNEIKTSEHSSPSGPVFTSEFPEIESFFRFRDRGSFLMKYEDNHYKEDKVIFADSSFFQFFDIPVLQGDPATALVAPNSIVLTKRMAEKYFGTQDAVGKSLILDNKETYGVKAVIEDIPSNTHFDVDFLLSMSTLEESRNNNWGSFNFNTYFLLKEGVDHAALKDKMQASLIKHFEPVLEQYVGVSYEDFIASGNYIYLDFMPLSKIHLHSDLQGEMAANSDIRYVYTFGLIGLFILVIAGINFVNLSTARSANRAKEVGVRKVVGAMRSHLVKQFLSESTLIALLSLILAYGLLFLLLPAFNDLSGKEFLFSKLIAPLFIVIAISIGLFSGILSGLYPAFYLSSFLPIGILKKNAGGKKTSNLFRNGLVVFQFFITNLLIVCTFVVFQQLQYMQNKKLGYNKEQVIVVNDAYALDNNVQAFKSRMLNNPAVNSVSVSGFLPVESNRNSSSFFRGTSPSQENAIILSNWTVDFDYVKTMGMEVIKGRDFDVNMTTDSSAIIINEELARQLAFDDPVGKKMSGYTSGEEEALDVYTIIGVIKDFHYESLRDAISPLALFIGNSSGAISMRMQTDNMAGFLSQLETDWNEMAPGQPFSYQFMDERFSRMFRQEQQLGKIVGVFSFIAIFIACIGLLGLATFIAQQRTKEIGIRKVLGASIPNLVYLLCKDFGKLILLAFAFAIPVSWYFMNQWLADFAYATSIGVSVFLIAGLLILLMTGISVFYQSTRVALINPVDTLKNE